jgi:flagellar hook-length control protein FliK
VPEPQHEQLAVQAVEASVREEVGREKPPAVSGAKLAQAELLRPVEPQPAEILALVKEQSGANAGSLNVSVPLAAEGPPQDAKPAILKSPAVPRVPSAQAGADVRQDQPAARETSIVSAPDAVLAQAPVQAAAVEAPLARAARVMRSLSGDDLAADGLQPVQADAAGKAAEARPRAAETLSPDQERLIARIAGAISQAERAGRTTVRIRLYPPEMGTVKIEVTSHRGAVTARIEVSTPATHGVLQSNLAALRADLRQAGVDIRDVQVQYRDPAAAFGPQDRSAGRGAQEERRFAKRQAQTDQTQPVESVPAYSDVGWTGRLNVFV